MTRSRLLFLLLSVAVILTLVGGQVFARQAGEDSLYKYLSVFTNVLNLVEQTYVEPVAPGDLLQGALEGVGDALDPFVTFVPADGLPRYEAARRTGDGLSGLVVVKQRGVVYAAAVAPGSPADEAGLERGDIVSAIDGKPTRRLGLWEIQEILAQPAGTRVPLEIRRQGAHRAVELQLRPFDRARPTLERREGHPLVRIPYVDDEARSELSSLLDGVDAAEGLLVDLRGSTGEATAAYAVAGLFVSGDLGELRSRSGSLRRFSSAASPRVGGRLVVLVDRGSLGAGEILAAILRQGAGARLVGESTFGYAGRQTLLPLDSGGAVLLTDAFYAGPDGSVIDDSLEPDVEISAASRRFSEAEVPLSDLILERGLEVLASGEREAA